MATSTNAVVGAAGPSATPDLGFELQPGEVLLFFRRLDHGAEKTALVVFGILLLPILAGIFLLVAAAQIAGKKPTLVAVTNLRLVRGLAGQEPRSIWLRELADVAPIRPSANTSGQGALGAAIGAAVVHARNAAAARQDRTSPGFWTGTVALDVAWHDGRKERIEIAGEAPMVGMVLARLQAGANHLLNPLDPARAAATLAPAPPNAGRIWRGTPIVLLPLAFALVIGGIGDFALPKDGPSTSVQTIVALGVVTFVVAAALFVVGSVLARRAISAGRSPKRMLLVGNVIYGLAAVACVAVWVLEYESRADHWEEYAAKSAKRQPTEATPGTGSGATHTQAGATSDPFLAQVTATLRARGYEATPSSTGPLCGVATETELTVKRPGATLGPMVVVGTFTSSATDVDACVAGVAAEHAFAADISGAGHAAAAGPLKAALTARPITSHAALKATLQSAGWTPSAGVSTDYPHFSGRRTHLAFATKGSLHVTVHVVDFAPATRGGHFSLVKSATHFLIVDGEFANPGEGKSVAAFLAVP